MDVFIIMEIAFAAKDYSILGTALSLDSAFELAESKLGRTVKDVKIHNSDQYDYPQSKNRISDNCNIGAEHGFTFKYTATNNNGAILIIKRKAK